MNRTLGFSLRALAAAALIAAWHVPVSAQDMDMDNGDHSSKHEAAKARCEQMSGSQKESCMKQAEKKQNGDKSEHKQMKEEYKAEKKKCEAMSGADKDTCMEELKTKYHH